jgi:hypothetical protein
LIADAERDRDAVGVPLRLIHQAQFKPAAPILASSGIVFTTYSMLSTDFDGDRQRFKQLTDWLGPDFDGVIAFDEAHLMKNAAATPHGGKATVVVRHTFEAAAESATQGFYRNRRSERIYAISDHWDAIRNEVFLTGVKGPRRSLERQELDQKYVEVGRVEARTWWTAEFAATPAAESKRFHILSGAIFPIYDKVMGSSGIQSVKIARAVLADGQALVGLNLSPSDVPNVKQRLGIGTPLGQASPAEILDLVNGGAVIELDNGWRLTPSACRTSLAIPSDWRIAKRMCSVPTFSSPRAAASAEAIAITARDSV